MQHSSVKPNEITRKWYVVDARNMILGRLSTKVAELLMGKNRPYYTPHWDMGDYVVVINAEKVTLTGKKETDKVYYRHTGYPGGLRTQSAAEVREKYPEQLIERAVYGMLPKNRLRERMIEKLYVYQGTEHPHEAQQPESLPI